VRELFVWYRVAPSAAVAARAAVLAMQQALMAEHPGLAARLLVRRDDANAPQTWMETYACAASAHGIDPALERSIMERALSLATVLEGPRHVEAFEPSD
jgi:hypothetical protein